MTACVCDLCGQSEFTWDPEGSGVERCYDCLERQGWVYDASDEDRDGGWQGEWTLGRKGKLIRDAALLPAQE